MVFKKISMCSAAFKAACKIEKPRMERRESEEREAEML